MAENRPRIVIEVPDDLAKEGIEKINARFADMGAKVVRMSETSRSALDRLSASVEKQAALYGKTGIEKLIAMRDMDIKKCGQQQEAIDRVTKAYDQMIAKQKELDAAGNAAGNSWTSMAGKVATLLVSMEALKTVVKDVAVETALFAAKAHTYEIAMEAAGRANNVSVQLLHQQEAALKGQGIATVEARQSLLRMVTAQIDVNKATELGRLAQNAAVISMTNSSEAFEQLIYGIQSGQPRVLRTMGINVNFQESYEKLAKSLGKTSLELSDYEKVQARVNTVLEVAPRFAGLYEESMTTVGKQITSLKRHFDDAKISIGDQFQPALMKVVETLTELLKLIKDHPELGVAITAAATGGLAAIVGKMVAGGTGAAVAGGAAYMGLQTYATYKLIEAGGTTLARGSEALFGTEAPATTQAREDLAGLAAKSRGTAAQTSQSNLFKALGVPQGWMGGSGSFGEKTESLYDKSWEQWISGIGNGQDRLKRQKEMSDKMLSQAYENKDRPGYQKELAHNEALKEQIKQYEIVAAAKKHVDDLDAKAREFEQDALTKIGVQREKELADLSKVADVKLRTSLRDRVNADYDIEVAAEKNRQLKEYLKLSQEFEAHAHKESMKRQEDQKLIDDARGYGFKEDVEGFKTDEKITNIQMAGERAMIEAQAGKAMRLAELGAGGDRRAGIESGYALQLKLAQQLYDIEIDRVRVETDGNKAAEMVAKAEVDLKMQLFKAEEDHETKILELQHKRFEGLKGSISSLLDAAFVKSKDLLSLFTNTIKAALFAPIKEGLSNLLANALMPTIYGKDGKGGIFGSLSGMFGGKKGGIQDVQLHGGAVPIVGTVTIAGASGGGPSGYGGTTMPANFPGAFGAGPMLAGLGSTMGIAGILGSGGSRSIETIGGGSSTAGLSQNAFGLWNRAGSAGSLMPTDGAWSDYFGNAASGFGGRPGGAGGGGLLSSLSGGLSGLKGAFFNSGSIYGPGGYATTAAGIGHVGEEAQTAIQGIKGTAAGILTSSGAGAAMTMGGGLLTQAGLFGDRRGTSSGILMGTAGGALLGAGIGTMIMPGLGTAIGAGIGAVAGFTTGIIEKLVGTKATQAHDQIKQVYGVDIPTHGSLMKQILQMIDSQYGGSISTGIRSQPIRELIQLYSEGTGQKMPLNPYTPRAAGTSSQGGKLYQDPFYQNGQAYSFSSSLPTLPGTGPTMPAQTGGYAAPGGSVQFSLDGPATTRVLSGQVVNAMVPGLVH